MGKNKNDNKISLTQLVLLGLGSLIGSVGSLELGKHLQLLDQQPLSHGS